MVIKTAMETNFNLIQRNKHLQEKTRSDSRNLLPCQSQKIHETNKNLASRKDISELDPGE